MPGFLKPGLAATLLLALYTPPLSARPIHFWSPDELAPKTAVICNAVPESVNLTGEKWERQSVHYQNVIAKLRVIGVARGDLKEGAEIEVRYSMLDEPRGGVTPPIRMYFEKGKRCRVYLNPAAGHPWYVGAIAGELDDGSAAQPLEPDEPDRALPLFKAEAIQLASAYYRKIVPTVKIDPEKIVARYDWWNLWTVQYYSKPPLDYPEFTSDAEIFVNASRRIDEKRSWIADGLPFSAKELNSHQFGASLRIVADRLPGREMAPGNRYLIWGRMTGFVRDGIVGQFRCSGERDLAIPVISVKSIVAFQVLKKSPAP